MEYKELNVSLGISETRMGNVKVCGCNCFLVLKIFYFVDINECESNPCRRGERCENLSGKFRCVPRIQCTVGYELNEDGTSCNGK